VRGEQDVAGVRDQLNGLGIVGPRKRPFAGAIRKGGHCDQRGASTSGAKRRKPQREGRYNRGGKDPSVAGKRFAVIDGEVVERGKSKQEVDAGPGLSRGGDESQKDVKKKNSMPPGTRSKNLGRRSRNSSTLCSGNVKEKRYIKRGGGDAARTPQNGKS